MLEISLGREIVASTIKLTIPKRANAISLLSRRSISPGWTALFPMTLIMSSACWIETSLSFSTSSLMSLLRLSPEVLNVYKVSEEQVEEGQQQI